MFTLRISRRWWLFPALCSCLLLSGCPGGSGGGGGRQFVDLGTAPVGGAFYPVGGAIAEVLNNHPGKINWRVQAKGTNGSQENIHRLDQGELQLALSNAAITYFAVRGESGWEKKFDMRAVATLAPNVALFITKQSSGIRTIADLKGKSVCIGPAGAGFEMFVTPILEEHGVTMKDIRPVNLIQSEAVDQLGDGTIDAAFLGGAVPTASISQAATSHDIHFIPFEEEVRQRLIEKYPFFHSATIPATNSKGDPTYRGMTEDFQGLNVGSMHLITAADVDEELIYEITKSLWENRDELGNTHPAGRTLRTNATLQTGTEFHPGAVRAYQEAGVWPDAEGQSTASDEAPQAEESQTEPQAVEDQVPAESEPPADDAEPADDGSDSPPAAEGDSAAEPPQGE